MSVKNHAETGLFSGNLPSLDQQPSPPSWVNSQTEKDAADRYVNYLKKKGLAKGSRLLLFAHSSNLFQAAAEREGWQVCSVSVTEKLNSISIEENYDAAVIIYQVEKSGFPQKLLNQIHSALKPDGIIMVVIPSLSSNSARFFGSAWTEWRPENRFYFDNITLQLFLWRCNFNHLEITKDRRKYTLMHIFERARSFPHSWITRTIKLLYGLVPKKFRGFHVLLPSSGVVVMGNCAKIHDPQICTLVVPAYNEINTFPILMDSLLKKVLPGNLQKEIIVVESNSSDGTREKAMEYRTHPDVVLILQDKPNGKGNAVREGFNAAKGDILLIQDADLEYDLNDLDVLLEPILNFHLPFILGSRHGGQWKMREFANERELSTFFNLGHKLFTALLNLMYNQHLKDPFTMYKIFRRDCLYGLALEANRFDFDFELVIKLIRKGYRPKEIPINYRSRSFKEGKKVRVFRDPLTWIWALIKYRFATIYKKNGKMQ